MSLFLFFSVVTGLTGRGWAAAIYPAGGGPSPQHTRTACTPQAAAQAAPKYQGGQVPGQTMQGTTRARTLDTLHRDDRDGGGCWTACNVSGKVYNFGRLFLSIFIWICFTKSIDNPYIYGYNIISPDKYGLQPH